MDLSIPDVTRACLNFEQYQWATPSVLEDPFYSVDESTASAAPGAVLKVEKSTNTAFFSLPPGTALSRIVYQSKSFNGSLVPVSAYILWPHNPRSAADGYQVVAFSHGTSGITPNCAPSHIKNLWQHYLAPFNLALQGYVVVATDYAGLGVSRDAHGQRIVHEYLTSPSHAHDVLFSVEAAQAAFPELSRSFVIVGHSQGGGSVWAAAERQAVDPAPGYLGSVAISPVTSIIDPATAATTLPFLGFHIAAGMENIFPNFNRSEILTPEGVQKLSLLERTNGCISTTVSLIANSDPTKPDWTENSSTVKWQELTRNGGKAIRGPLLVIHGDGDPILNISLVTRAVEETARASPDAQIEYLRLSGVSHNAALTASQWIWMDWIAKRFAGTLHESGLKVSETKIQRPGADYQAEVNWWLAPATMFYETP